MGERHELTEPLTVSCPDCIGPMRRELQHGVVQYRCHIGHVMSPEVLFVAQRQVIEQHLCKALALLNERVKLCRDLADLERRRTGAGARYQAAAEVARDRAEQVRAIVEDEWSVSEATD